MAQRGKRIGTWVILGLLFLGLIGFGTTGLSGRLTSVGTVGKMDIAINDYARELSGQIEAFSAQTGEPLSFPIALQIGIDRFALGQLVARRALDNELRRIGVSVGDATVAESVMGIMAFRGTDGAFDRDTYSFVLDSEGLDEAEFEEGIREDITRAFLQGAVVGGIPAPAAYADAVSRYIGEERDIRYVIVNSDKLDVPPMPPRPDDLTNFYEANPELFTEPEARDINYAWLTPAMIQDSIEIDQTALEELYQSRISEFVQPERRLVERLVMPDEATANDVLAQIELGGATFDTAVADRGLTLSDVDLGDVTLRDLGDAGEAIFAAQVGEAVGPLETDFGPAIFRVNAVLDAIEVTFEEALPDLREELAAVRAQRVIDDARDNISDLMAGGAGVADLAANTAMEAGQITWTEDVSDGIAAYAVFHEAALAAEEGSFPELMELDDGGLFVIELTGITPPAVRPFADVEDEVLAAWTAEAIAAEVDVLAERFASLLIQNGDFTDEMGEVVTETGVTRRSFLADAPQGLVEEIFGVSEGGLAMAREDGTVAIARIDAIRGPDPEDPEVSARSATIAEQAAAGISDDLLTAFMTRLQEQTEVSINQAAINAVHTSFQ